MKLFTFCSVFTKCISKYNNTTIDGCHLAQHEEPNNTCLGYNNSSCWARGNHQLYVIWFLFPYRSNINVS